PARRRRGSSRCRARWRAGWSRWRTGATWVGSLVSQDREPLVGPGQRRRDALVEGELGPPVEELGGAVDVRERAHRVAGARWRLRDLNGAPRDPLERRHQLPDGHAVTATDVDHHARRAVRLDHLVEALDGADVG